MVCLFCSENWRQVHKIDWSSLQIYNQQSTRVVGKRQLKPTTWYLTYRHRRSYCDFKKSAHVMLSRRTFWAIKQALQLCKQTAHEMFADLVEMWKLWLKLGQICTMSTQCQSMVLRTQVNSAVITNNSGTPGDITIIEYVSLYGLCMLA